MPIYQYLCSNCGHQFDALQKMSDPKLTDCPECKTASLRKQLTAAAFQLKGTGWYATDFKDSGKKPAAKAKSETPSASASESSTSSSAASE